MLITIVTRLSSYSGAWITLAIWDHISYKMDLRVVSTYLLPITKGIATFFLDYLLPVYPDYPSDQSFERNNLNDTVYFTGPSTSPETSFATNTLIATVAFTPAIDASILRQIANSYILSVRMLESYDKSNKFMRKREVSEHRKLGEDVLHGTALKSFRNSYFSLVWRKDLYLVNWLNVRVKCFLSFKGFWRLGIWPVGGPRMSRGSVRRPRHAEFKMRDDEALLAMNAILFEFKFNNANSLLNNFKLTPWI